MSKKRDDPLLLTLKPSLRLRRLMGVVHLLALAACIAAFLSLIGKCALSLAIAVHFWAILKRLKKDSYVIKYTQLSGWEVAKNGGFAPVTILPSTVISPHALFLHIEIQHNNAHIPRIRAMFRRANRKAILILADMLEDDGYRCLIVKLRTAAIKQEQGLAPIDKI